MKYVEYLHLKSNKVYSHSEEFTTDTEMYWNFQQSNDPTTLGFKYERDFREAETEKPEAV
jgi:hypothetical protein